MKHKLVSAALVIALVLSVVVSAAPFTVPAAVALAVKDSAGLQQAPSTPIYLDTSYSFEERAADLVSRMTLAEKASQMISSRAPAIARLGVREYGWWNEALHGVAREQLGSSGNATTLQNTTSYPIDLSLGSSWDPELMYREASMISDEAREVVVDNRLNLDFWSPTINLSRDPRWGRNDESYGEDPFLVTQIVAQFVNGMEGKDMNGELLPEGNGYLKTITTLKHYAANNSEVNRLNGTSNMDDRTLREYYTAAFKGIVQQAGVNSVMSSYNRVNGVPAAASVYLIDNLLRQTFGFKGYVTSDCDAIYEISQSHHWIPPTWARQVNQIERMAFAMSAGEDLDCNAGYSDAWNYQRTVPGAALSGITTETGQYTENDIDTSLVRLFTARMKLGEFDDPNLVPWVTAARARVPQGTWTNSNNNLAITETPERLAMTREVGDKSLVLLKNSVTTKKDGTTGKLLPLQIPASGPFNVAVVGYFANPNSIYLGGYSSTQGSNGVAKMVNGYNGIKNAILAINSSATVTYYKGFTSGTTAATLTTIDPAAVTAAAAADLAIVYVGTDSSTANEAGDRANVSLPGAQASLIKQVGQANPNTITYMETIGMMDVTTFEPYVSAMLWSSYNGQRKGEALADVLLGNYNPSGHLPFMWFQSNSQLPPITDYTLRPTATNPGRTYMYYNSAMSGTVSYPFGFGLSYSTFDYSNLQIDQKDLDANDTFQVSVDVTNSSAVKGNEVVQLYVTTPDAAPALERPIKRLRGFQKISLEPGETKTVNLTAKVPDLAFFDQTLGKYVVDTGRYGIQISISSADADIQLQDFIQVTGTLKPVLNVVTVKPTQEGDATWDIPTRVMFIEDKVVNPNITVAMNDETLYGYIKKNGSQPFPASMTFEYSSNHPEVVAVDASGVIRTVGSGVATVTANVTYEGVTKSTAFTVRVFSKLNGITIDGQPITGFSPDVYRYNFLVPDNQPVPQVNATATSPNATVAITQAASVPGSAVMTVTEPDGIAVTYTVYFAFEARSDEFNGGQLGAQWSWVRQDATQESITSNPGFLTINTRTGDLNATTNTAKNILVQNALGDWTIESKLVFSRRPAAATEQGGIIAYQDDNNYLKVGWEATNSTTTQFNVTLEDNGSGTAYATTLTTLAANSIVPASGSNANTVWFKMSKSGTKYTAYYSVDGTNFTPLFATGASLANLKVGLFAYNRTGTSTTLSVGFDYFRVKNTADARTYYNGNGLFWTSSVNSTSANVTLSAAILDLTAADPTAPAPNPDYYLRDVRYAKVTFVNRDTNIAFPGCTDLPVGLVNPDDTRTGIATCNTTLTADKTTGASQYTVGIVVSGYYERNSSEDDSIITVAQPIPSNFITGGGHLVLSNSAGQVPGTAGSKTNFGFNVKYTKSGTNLQGNINIIVRSGGHVYKIKSTALSSLGVSGAAANFSGKANITDVTDPLNPISLEGNATLQLWLTDNGEPGTSDTLGIQVLSKNGGMWFSSNWSGTRTVEQALGGGNLAVH